MISLKDLKEFEVITTGCIYGGDCSTGAGSATWGGEVHKYYADTVSGSTTTYHTITDKSTATEPCDPPKPSK